MTLITRQAEVEEGFGGNDLGFVTEAGSSLLLLLALLFLRTMQREDGEASIVPDLEEEGRGGVGCEMSL